MFRIERIYTSWTYERILRHVLYWLAWLLFYATVNSSTSDQSIWDWTVLELLVMTIKLPFTYFVIYYLVPRYLFKKQYLQFGFAMLLFATIGGFILSFIYAKIILPEIFGIEYKYGLKKVHYLVLDLIYIASLPTIYKLVQLQNQQEKLTLQVAEQKLGAELKLLKNQLHPHFLFNTLNNLYGMVLTGDKNAPDVVVRLSDLMSYMLYECEGDSISLEKEIENLQNYIALEKIRYGDRLDIAFETGGDLADKSIAPLLLIPFFENAFKHGVERSEQASWVRINLWVKENTLHFLIENSISPNSEEDLEATQSGIGLTNVRKRLELLYPEKHELNIQKTDTFMVQLNLELNNEVSDR